MSANAIIRTTQQSANYLNWGIQSISDSARHVQELASVRINDTGVRNDDDGFFEASSKNCV